MSFGWNLFQQLHLRSVDRLSGEADIKSRSNAKDIAKLEEKVDALSMACHAMWELLQEKHGVTNQQLDQRIQEIDMRDGKLDGKLDLSLKKCPDCGHKLNGRHANCFYCGADLTDANLFYKS